MKLKCELIDQTEIFYGKIGKFIIEDLDKDGNTDIVKSNNNELSSLSYDQCHYAEGFEGACPSNWNHSIKMSDEIRGLATKSLESELKLIDMMHKTPL